MHSSTLKRSSKQNIVFKVNDNVWCIDENEAWLCGKVIDSTEIDTAIKTELGEVRRIKNRDLLLNVEPAGSHIHDNIENLVDLDELSEGAILHHVRKRFKNKNIYTFVGAILVAVNPFEYLPIYTAVDIRKAANCRVTAATYPHVFVTASTAFHQLMMHSKNQAILISGESGAGKTETTKKVLTYLAATATDDKKSSEGDVEKSVEEKILQSNPLLEAIGNAKTLRNNNSSRFGKWMKVYFDSSYSITGCEIVNYLLEKSRVVCTSLTERNYHIFYQLIKGLDDTTRERLHLKDVNDYRYLTQSKCTTIDGVDDAEDFKEVATALSTLKFDVSTQDHMFRILAAILSLGNISFDSFEDEMGVACQLSAANMTLIDICAELLGVDKDDLSMSLKQRFVQMGKGSVVAIKYSPIQASDCRDTLARALYGNLFDWIISFINESLKTEISTYYIGILDIFGFEVFESNSFEQLCINYANEKLQYHFNEVIFHQEIQMYESEGIPLDRIVFVDNSECVKLIEGKPYGLILLLDEECSLGNGTDASYINKIDKIFGTTKAKENVYFIKHRTKPTIFSVKHFAGPVEYDVTNFIDKNRDTLSGTCKEVMIKSVVSLVSSLFTQDQSMNDGNSAIPASVKRAGVNILNSSKVTLGSQFRNQLVGLVQTLRDTEPHFIRCVKPNHQKCAGLFDGQLALRQLRYAGLFEAIRIRKSGFSYRTPLNVFANSYYSLVTGLAHMRKADSLTDKDVCIRIMAKIVQDKVLLPNDGYIGNTKVFLKTNQNHADLDRMKISKALGNILMAQRLVRRYLKRLRDNKEMYERQKEAMKAAAERKIEEIRLEVIKKEEEDRLKIIHALHTENCIVIQRKFRRYHMRLRWFLIPLVLKLRAAVIANTINDLSSALVNLDRILPAQSSDYVCGLAIEEVRMAKQVLIALELQAQYKYNLEKAIEYSDGKSLKVLISKAHEYQLSDDPLIEVAAFELKNIHRKHKVMEEMVSFLQNEDCERLEQVPMLLDEAHALGVDGEFVLKVRRVYDKIGPKLLAKYKLRQAVETVDHVLLVEAIADVEFLRFQHSTFAEVEYRAGMRLLRLLQLDLQLYPTDKGPITNDISVSLTVTDTTGAVSDTDSDGESFHDAIEVDTAFHRLTPEYVRLCSIITSTSISSVATADATDAVASVTDDKAVTTSTLNRMAAKKQLQALIYHDVNKYYRIIRSYKWSVMMSVWKHPEIKQLIDSNASFYGLRIGDAYSNRVFDPLQYRNYFISSDTHVLEDVKTRNIVPDYILEILKQGYSSESVTTGTSTTGTGTTGTTGTTGHADADTASHGTRRYTSSSGSSSPVQTIKKSVTIQSIVGNNSVSASSNSNYMSPILKQSSIRSPSSTSPSTPINNQQKQRLQQQQRQMKVSPSSSRSSPSSNRSSPYSPMKKGTSPTGMSKELQVKLLESRKQLQHAQDWMDSNSSSSNSHRDQVNVWRPFTHS